MLAEKSMIEMRTKFQDIEVAIKKRMKKIFDQLNERGKILSGNQIGYKKECIEGSKEADMSTQFFRIQKKISSFNCNNICRDIKILYLFLDLRAVDMI